MVQYTEDWKRQRAEEAATWLRRIQRKAMTVKRMVAELNSFIDATGIKGTDYSAVRVSSSPTPDGVHELAVRHMELLERSQSAAIEYMAELEVALDAIDSMEDARHQEVLSAHYIQCKPWHRIASEMNYSERHIYTLRMDALDAIYDHMPPEFKTKLEPAL